MRSASLVLALVGSACVVGDFSAPAERGTPGEVDIPDRPAGAMRLLQANVGNLAFTCRGYAFNLCQVSVEERIAAAIAELDPDVVTLQELVSPSQCDDLGDGDPARVCHPDRVAVEPAQVRRLLGPEYTVACDNRAGYECIAVHPRFATIEGCADGGDCEARTAVSPAGCDGGFTVSGVTAVRGSERFGIVNGHPPSGSSVECRRDQLERVLVAGEAVSLDEPAILAGDFNLDPFSGDDAASALWSEHVGPGRRFAYHSGPAERQPPHATSFSLIGDQVLDHVASDFAAGHCWTLGEAPNTSRLDGGAGTDHRALLCDLEP